MRRKALPPGVEKYADKRRLSERTREAYADVIARAKGSDLPPEKWLASITEDAPVGTLLPYRAAVKLFLMHDHGWTVEEIEEILPTTRGRVPTKIRGALNAERRKTLRTLVAALPPGPVPVILQLILLTGLRCEEACSLQEVDIDGDVLHVLGKGQKRRNVPLGKAKALLERWREERGPSSTWVFPGRFTKHVSTSAIRKVTRTWKAQLGQDFSPHVLRHTWATLAVKNEMMLPEVQAFLGHASLATTSRYLHADPDGQTERMERAQEDD